MDAIWGIGCDSSGHVMAELRNSTDLDDAFLV
jgi:hypothetical protein